MSLHYLGKHKPQKWSFQYHVSKTTVLQLAILLTLMNQFNNFV